MKPIITFLLIIFFVLSGLAFSQEKKSDLKESVKYSSYKEAFDKCDYTKALELAKPLAEKGDAEAQLILGFQYRWGKGVTQNYTEALKWLSKSANQGNSLAQFQVGAMYYNGWGVQQNYKEAMKWYAKSAEQGYDVAQSFLGKMYYEGYGVSQNYTEAMKWFSKAAEKDFPWDSRYLGIMYYKGQGVTQDYIQAYKWFCISLSLFPQDKNTAKLKDDLTKKMTPNQIKKAQELVNDWNKNH